MNFNFIIRRTEQEITTTTLRINIGQQICGLQKAGHRPQTVTLTSSELAFLLKNVPYGLKVVTALDSTPNDI